MTIAYIIACVPPVALLIYVWYLDRLEHEPIGLVAGVFLASGILGTFAASFLEGVGETILQVTFIGALPVIGDVLYFFCVVALVEELCKFAPVRLLVWNNKAFDHRFDVVVYCVASAIGFAFFENVMYVAVFGADVALGRLIPVHTICGVLMGYFLACAKICERGGNGAKRASYMRRSILVPILVHGFWDFALSSDSDLLATIALVGIMVLTVYAWSLLKSLAKFDAPL